MHKEKPQPIVLVCGYRFDKSGLVCRVGLPKGWIKYIYADLLSTCLLKYTIKGLISNDLFHLGSWLYGCGLLDEELSLDEFEYFVNQTTND